MQVDLFVLDRSPGALDEDVFAPAAFVVHVPSSFSSPVKASLVNWLPRSVLKISLPSTLSDVSDLHGPDLIGTSDGQAAQLVGINPVSWRGFGRIGPAIDDLDAHPDTQGCCLLHDGQIILHSKPSKSLRGSRAPK